MDDLIRRMDVIDMLAEMQGRCTSKTALIQNSKIWQQIKDMPPAQPTVEAVERKKGEWIFEPKDAIELMFTKPKCSKCGYESADGGNFCSNCGADMRTKETDHDYERSVEQLEHDMLYEPTYNPDDGSM